MVLYILLIVMAFVLIAILPVWPYSRPWGPIPAAVVGVIVLGLWIYVQFLAGS